MNGADVIELGSSDEETKAPTAKKTKPRPNAMVHIPNKLPGITIKPASACKSNNQVQMRTVIMSPKRTGLGLVPVQNLKINPLASNQLKKKVQSLGNEQKRTAMMRIKHGTEPKIKILQNPMKIHNKIPNLPPSITIKRTKKDAPSGSNVKRKVTQTVELDDDEPSPVPKRKLGPQWYVRPEDHETEDKQEVTEQEKQNNKEPELKNFIEITIEDSPVKPPKNKTDASELSVVIEDSPHKHTPVKTLTNNKRKGSPCGNKDRRKILKYPTEIEVEFEPIQEKPTNKNEDSQDKCLNDVIEIEESPMKLPDEASQSPKKQTSDPLQEDKNPNPISSKAKQDPISPEVDPKSHEFHPVYQSLIDLCFQLENTDDMKKIVEKKIKAYYKQVPKTYTESEEFIDMVSSKIMSIKAGPDKMYLYIKDIVDELNLQRKIAKNTVPVAEETQKNDSQTFLYGEDSQFDAKRQRQIRKLDKTIKKLHRAIQKLEEQEVDFDDEDDSVYLLTERYKERMIKVHAKFCQLTNTKMPSEPRIHIDATPGKPVGAAKRLEKWINRKVPIGSALPFPDFHDVLRCVREANQEDKLGWNEADIMEEARNLFVRCGRKLQRRRQENEWRLVAARLTTETDPAEHNDDLKKLLEANKKHATKMETEVFNKFADKQNQLNLEAEEIGDKEADESPDDSEDDEVADENLSLDNKKNRKERLKRLLSDKSSQNKENDSENKSVDVEMTDVQGNSIQVDDTQTKLRDDEDESKTSEVNVEKSKTSKYDSDINSDIDELHLLQKLHSEKENNTESSDSASAISISESLESDSDDNQDQTNDVISIEDSSFSEEEKDDRSNTIDKTEFICCSFDENKESETNISFSTKLKENKDTVNTSDPRKSGEMNSEQINEDMLLASEDDLSKDTVTENCVNLQDDADSSKSNTDGKVKETNKDEVNEIENIGNEQSQSICDETNNNCSQIIESYLLASSEDDLSQDASHGSSVNLRDDAISIGDTVVENLVGDNGDQNIPINKEQKEEEEVSNSKSSNDAAKSVEKISLQNTNADKTDKLDLDVDSSHKCDAQHSENPKENNQNALRNTEQTANSVAVCNDNEKQNNCKVSEEGEKSSNDVEKDTSELSKKQTEDSSKENTNIDIDDKKCNGNTNKVEELVCDTVATDKCEKQSFETKPNSVHETNTATDSCVSKALGDT